MPVATRASDEFTRDNLLLGFSQVFFTPVGSATSIPMGILSSQSLNKTVEVLQLPKGDSGTVTVDRELVGRVEFQLAMETFNFKANLAQLLFGSDVLTAVTADAAASTSSNVTIPTTDPFDVFLDLDHATIDESTVEVTFNTITDEAVGTGDGATNAFILDQKVKALTDINTAGHVTVTVGGTPTVYTAVGVGAATAGNEVEVIIGETDGAAGTGSGSLEFFVGGASTPPASGAVITASYTPSFTTTASDIVNLTDFVFDPTLGKIRFLDPAGADNSPFRTTGDDASLNVAYDYNRKASFTLQPGRKNATDGTAVINHLTDVGVNFIWTIPSATVRLTDDELSFGTDDFAVGTLILNINDAGGTSRFGTIAWSSEPEAGA